MVSKKRDILRRKGGLVFIRKIIFSLTLMFVCIYIFPVYVNASENKENIYQERMHLYKTYETPFVPWHRLAAVDQYERNIQEVRKGIDEVSRGEIATPEEVKDRFRKYDVNVG